jgi:hypothetical protein
MRVVEIGFMEQSIPRSGILRLMRYRVIGSPQPLPAPVEDPLHKAAFSYRVQGVAEGATPTMLFEVYAQRQTLYPYAERACRLLLACYDLARTRLGLDHALRYDRLLRVFLMTEGKAGAEQQQNLMYLYDLSERVPPQAWLRELTHEYGHWIIPPINSYEEPEPWANGDLGERWFTYHLVARARDTSGEPDFLMGAPLSALEAYLRRAVEPLIERMAREGLNPQRWRSRRRAGYEECLALALYIDRLYGSERLGRAMLCAGGVEPDDFLRGARESLTEPEQLRVQLPFANGYLFLPGGAARWRIVEPRGATLIPDPKRPEWARCSVTQATLRKW